MTTVSAVTTTTGLRPGIAPALAALTAGRDALRAGQAREAFAHFAWAHSISHEVRPLHLAAHRGMARAAWADGRIGTCASQSALLMAALVVDHHRRH